MIKNQGSQSQTEIRLTKLMPWQHMALVNPYTHFALYAGISVGKTFTGAHFIIKNILEHPEKTGLVGANNYIQLSTVALRELFYWFTQYGFEYVIDRMPPKSWNSPRAFKNYANIMCVRNPWSGDVSTLFTRVMSDPNPLRGIELSYAWMDETRDMAQESHDVILSRLRESDYIKTLITTTPNGEDWSYKRFCLTTYEDPYLYGSMHVKTYEAVKAGIISENFYKGLKASYSELMAQQELDAMHVNIAGGRAYYSAGEWNRKTISPWGSIYPDPNYPLIVGCDFNFDPAPHVWMVGQISPDGDRIHWFEELSRTRCSTPEMAYALVSRFPGYFYKIYGDRSGARATTSNAGRHDYAQISEVLADNGASFTVDSDQGSNPLVRNRIENMNRMLKDANGNIRMTYNHVRCPLFDSDMKMVGWKLSTNRRGQGSLDDGGNKTLTHASDGGGYALWKLFSPGMGAMIVEPTESQVISLLSQ